MRKENGNVLTLKVDFLVERLGAAVERRVGGIDSQLRVVNSGHVNRVDVRIAVVALIIQDNVVAARNEEIGDFGLMVLFVTSFHSEESDDEKRRHGDDVFD